MADNSFFDESSEQSRVKAAIVSKYFDAWARVISGRPNLPRIAYMDLFAGPGRYKDDTRSTPVLVLEKAIADARLREKLVCVFNDKNERSTKDLSQAIAEIPGIDTLKYRPEDFNEEIGSEIVKDFEKFRLAPTLFFVDPWGYKGLSLGLVNAVVKDWACECIFFLNYSRINMGLNNPFVVEHMNALFGTSQANELRNRLEGYTDPDDRESDIIETLCRSLNPEHSRFVLPFTFKSDSGARTSHHLIFVSKHVLGYTIMKDIMARESSSQRQGVPTFTYSPADIRFPVLFEYARPLDDLANMLLSDFRGQSITVRHIIDRHHIGKPFVERNYKETIVSLEDRGQVETNRSEQNRKRSQCPDHIMVRFRE